MRCLSGALFVVLSFSSLAVAQQSVQVADPGEAGRGRVLHPRDHCVWPYAGGPPYGNGSSGLKRAARTPPAAGAPTPRRPATARSER